MKGTFEVNYQLITKQTDRLFLFACDQKIEHLNADFHGENIHADAQNPEHLFNIASHSPIGAMAAPLELIARYGKDHKTVPYIIKLNGKTDLNKSTEPYSHLLWTVQDAVQFRHDSGLLIAGVGLTIYPGSEHEADMLHMAAQTIFQAHQEGLITILWVYPRGKSVPDDQDPQLLAGAVGLANSLGADFVKIKSPHTLQNKIDTQSLQRIVAAAGNSKVIISGGAQKDEAALLSEIKQYLAAGIAGCAIGRNIFQKSFSDATSLVTKINKLIMQQNDK